MSLLLGVSIRSRAFRLGATWTDVKIAHRMIGESEWRWNISVGPKEKLDLIRWLRYYRWYLAITVHACFTYHQYLQIYLSPWEMHAISLHGLAFVLMCLCTGRRHSAGSEEKHLAVYSRIYIRIRVWSWLLRREITDSHSTRLKDFALDVHLMQAWACNLHNQSAHSEYDALQKDA